MRYPSVVDDEGSFIRALGRNQTPMTLFLSPTGAVMHIKYGQFHGRAEIQTDVHRYLGLTA
jgi:hypothetical protein